MTTYNTGNPLGSSAAKDLYDNAQNLDFAVNAITQVIWKDRFARNRRTWYGIEKLALEAISSFGYITLDSFEDGANLTLPNQILRWESTGEYYRWDGEFPKDVPLNSTPESAGGIGRGLWLSIGDAALRQILEVSDNEANLFIYNNPYIPSNNDIDIGEIDPNFNGNGGGVISSNGINISFSQLSYNPSKENVIYNPGTFLRLKTGEAYPTRENQLHIGQCYRFVLSQGSKLNDDSKILSWITAVGNTIGCTPIEWKYVDAFGTNALMYAGRVSRTIAAGSESMAWFGSPSQQSLIDNCHDFWRKPVGNPYLPGEAGWNAGNLETNFPGIGTRLNAFNDYVTSSDDAAYCAAFGRDALNHIVRGIRNVSVGYQSSAYMFNASYNVSVGTLALQSCVFGDSNTAIGDQAGCLANDCYNSVFVGYGAGRKIRSSIGAVIIGDRAADNVLSANKSVIIGPQAGQDHPSSLDNKLIISSSPSTGNKPLISGDFNSTNAGVNILPEKLRTHLHVRDTDSGSVLTPPTGILVEGGGTSAITLETRNTGFNQIRFADPESSSSGLLEYSHASNTLTFGVNNASVLRMESDSTVRPWTDALQSFGRAAYRWSTGFFASGTATTSDRNYKEQEEDITQIEKRVAIKCKLLLKKYKYKDSVLQKGDKAKWHFGIVAQDLVNAFEEEGLNPEDYGVVILSTWEETAEEVRPEVTDESGGVIDQGYTIPAKPSGSAYSVRYEELLCFVIASI